ncbi:MAG: hypothetical protein WAW86_02535 [Gammaproteobacteria bacterium]
MLRKDEDIDKKDLGSLNLPQEILTHVISFKGTFGLQRTSTFFYNQLSEKRRLYRSMHEKIISTYLNSSVFISTQIDILTLLPSLILRAIQQEYDINTIDPKHYNKRLNHLGLLAMLMFEAIYALEKKYSYQYVVCIDEMESPNSHAFSSYISKEPVFNLLTEADLSTARQRHATNMYILKNDIDLSKEDNGSATFFDIMQAVQKSMHYLSLSREENSPKKSWLAFFWPGKEDPHHNEKKTLNHCIFLLTTAFFALENEINQTPVNVLRLSLF